MVVRRQAQQQQQFSSQGFDLDALAASSGDSSNNNVADDGDVIYEIGGGATAVAAAAPTTKSPTEEANEYKAAGNQAFKTQNWLEAVDMYTAAIQVLPGLTASELLQLQADYERQQQEIVRQRLAKQDEQQRRRRTRTADQEAQAQQKNENEQQQQQPEEPPLPPFTAPPHGHADRLAVLHANRAAALMGLHEYQSALPDVHAAILWKPDYVKAVLRRASLYEKLEDTEKALQDAKTAQRLDPASKQIRAAVQRLQKLEDERLEKLKTETLVSVMVARETRKSRWIVFLV